MPSNQWNACPTTTASIEWFSAGIASAVPSRISACGTAAASLAAISGIGSTATRFAPNGTSSRVSLPVPAARSRTALPGPIPSSRTMWAIASGE